MQLNTTHYLATQVPTTMLNTYHEAIEAMKPAIDILLENYEGFGGANQIDKDESPKIELQIYLDALDIHYPGAGKRKLKLAIRQFMTRLSCFRYRVMAKDEAHTVAVWNPLEQPLSKFLEKYAQQKIIYYCNNLPYPTADIISDWVSSHINEDMAAD